MVIEITNALGATVRATDGAFGQIEDFYFDDERWTVRYMVVDAEGTIGRRVLLSPISVARADLDTGLVDLALPIERIRHSPPFDAHQPVSRRYERQFSSYYGYAPYWAGVGYWGAGMAPAALAGVQPEMHAALASPPVSEHADDADAHLRSCREVRGYHIRATDGSIGHVDDFIADDESWLIRYLRVDTSNWIGGRAVLLPRQAVVGVDWGTREIRVDRSRDEVHSGPEYDPATLGRQYEQQLGTGHGHR